MPEMRRQKIKNKQTRISQKMVVIFPHIAFEEMALRSTGKGIHNLKINNASQGPDIPTKIIKEHFDIFAEF